jgi:hypothetical protein
VVVTPPTVLQLLVSEPAACRMATWKQQKHSGQALQYVWQTIKEPCDSSLVSNDCSVHLHATPAMFPCARCRPGCFLL